MVTAPHTPVPFSPALEDLYVPSGAAIAAAVRKTLASGAEVGALHVGGQGDRLAYETGREG